jgi:hypothetical protein
MLKGPFIISFSNVVTGEHVYYFFRKKGVGNLVSTFNGHLYGSQFSCHYQVCTLFHLAQSMITTKSIQRVITWHDPKSVMCRHNCCYLELVNMWSVGLHLSLFSFYYPHEQISPIEAERCCDTAGDRGI